MMKHSIIGRALRQVRLDAGLSQTQLGAILGGTRQFVSAVELGSAPMPVAWLERLPRECRGPVIDAMIAASTAKLEAYR